MPTRPMPDQQRHGQPAQRPAPDVHALGGQPTRPTTRVKSGARGERGQVIVNQLGAKALQKQERTDRPAQQEAKIRVGLAAHPGACDGSRHQGRPRVKDQGRDDGIIPRKTAVRLHVRGEPVDDLAAHREPQKLAPRRDADRDEPGGRQDRDSRSSPTASAAVSMPGRASPTTRPER